MIYLKCGCAAHAKRKMPDGTWVPSCVVHDCIEQAEVPPLENRMALCLYCNTSRPSSLTLPFFEFLGPGSPRARESCKQCGFHACAHDPAHMATLVPDRCRKCKGGGDETRCPACGGLGKVRRRTVVEDGRCTGFEARGDSGHDWYYCGCRGWD